MGLLVTRHISFTLQIADIFTKPLCKACMQHFCNKLCLQSRHSLREGINQNDFSTTNHLESTSWSDKDKSWSDKEIDQGVVILPNNRRTVESNTRNSVGIQSLHHGKSVQPLQQSTSLN